MDNSPQVLLASAEDGGVLRVATDKIVACITNQEHEKDLPNFRQVVIRAESYHFSADQNELLSPALLDIALRYRGSNTPGNEAMIWSAMRTGGSMLTRHTAVRLLPHLTPCYRVDTSKVALKMLFRIFEVHPPLRMHEQDEIGSRVKRILDDILNPHSLLGLETCSLANLGIRVLAAAACYDVFHVVRQLRAINNEWLISAVSHGLTELHKVRCTQDVADEVKVIPKLAVDLLSGERR